MSIEEKARFFRYSAKNLGASALCLSGGASFGYCESRFWCGVAQADQRRRPLWRCESVAGCGIVTEGHHGDVSGSYQCVSLLRLAGKAEVDIEAVAAFVCTRTDDELKEMLIPALADRITACEEPFRVRFAALRGEGRAYRIDAGLGDASLQDWSEVRHAGLGPQGVVLLHGESCEEIGRAHV